MDIDKKEEVDEQPLLDPNQKKANNKIPIRCVFILVVELCERFAFYGIQAVLFLYLTCEYVSPTSPTSSPTAPTFIPTAPPTMFPTMPPTAPHPPFLPPLAPVAPTSPNCTGGLAVSSTNATSLLSFFGFWAYAATIIGGIIADSWWGKFRTIWVLSLFYVLGLGVLSLSAVSAHGIQSKFGFSGAVVGIIFIGFGTGGIKANVGTFVADQVPGASEETLARIFRLFYWCINLGSIGGILLAPLMHHWVYNGWWLSFTVPSCMFIVALMILVAGKSLYINTTLPEMGNLVVMFFKVLGSARKNKKLEKQGLLGPEDSENGQAPSTSSPGKKKDFLDHAKRDYPGDIINGYKDVLRISKVFLPLPIYWALYSQQTNTWIAQANQMDLTLFNNFTITADQTGIVDPLVILVFIPVCDQLVFPLLKKCGLPLKPIPKMIIGFIFATGAFVSAALVQRKINLAEKDSISIWYQFPQYSLIALSEVFASVTGLEIAYSEAPESMKSFVMSLYMVTTAFGNLILLALANALQKFNTEYMFWTFAGLMIFFTLMFAFLFRNYKYKKESDAERNKDKNKEIVSIQGDGYGSIQEVSPAYYSGREDKRIKDE